MVDSFGLGPVGSHLIQGHSLLSPFATHRANMKLKGM